VPTSSATPTPLHYALLSPPGAPRGRVALLHGLLVGNLAAWYLSSAPALAAAGYEVLMLDLRGHGRSAPAPAGYDLPTLAGDLAALLDEVGWGAGPVALAGHSYGALVALEWALRHPGRAAAVLALDPPLRAGDLAALRLAPPPAPPPPAAPPEALLALLPAPLRAALGASLSAAQSAAQSAAAQSAAQPAAGRRLRRALEGWRALLADTTLLADLARPTPLTGERLRGLRAPLTVLYGERSPCRPAPGEESALRAAPRYAERVIEGAGHYLLNEAAGAVTAHALAALGAAEGGGAPDAQG